VGGGYFKKIGEPGLFIKVLVLKFVQVSIKLCAYKNIGPAHEGIVRTEMPL